MRRPASLAEVAEWTRDRQTFHLNVAEFVDEFRRAPAGLRLASSARVAPHPARRGAGTAEGEVDRAFRSRCSTWVRPYSVEDELAGRLQVALDHARHFDGPVNRAFRLFQGIPVPNGQPGRLEGSQRDRRLQRRRPVPCRHGREGE